LTTGAVKVLAVLADSEQTETEIAISSGLNLTEVRTALDELLLTRGVQEQVHDGLRFYSIGRDR
jgi:transcription initiation factor IIE alpha subunit